jgi:hypothetical protein
VARLLLDEMIGPPVAEALNAGAHDALCVVTLAELRSAADG